MTNKRYNYTVFAPSEAAVINISHNRGGIGKPEENEACPMPLIIFIHDR